MPPSRVRAHALHLDLLLLLRLLFACTHTRTHTPLYTAPRGSDDAAKDRGYGMIQKNYRRLTRGGAAGTQVRGQGSSYQGAPAPAAHLPPHRHRAGGGRGCRGPAAATTTATTATATAASERGGMRGGGATTRRGSGSGSGGPAVERPARGADQGGPVVGRRGRLLRLRQYQSRRRLRHRRLSGFRAAVGGDWDGGCFHFASTTSWQ